MAQITTYCGQKMTMTEFTYHLVRCPRCWMAWTQKGKRP